MKIKIKITILISLLIVFACSQPKIDTSTDETMKNSIEQVKSSLSEEKKAKFEKAIVIIAFSGFEFKNIFSKDFGSENIESDMKQKINGKTANEIIAMAEEIKKEREVKEREQALQEIKELEENKSLADNHKKELSKFKIIRSRYYKRKSYIGTEPIIELTVKNNTSHPISRAYFIGTLASPNRSIPWLKESFNYDISGGVEPGEQAAWKLSPNMFSDWGTVDAPKDAILTVDVVQLDGPDGKELFSVRNFTEKDADRLKELKAKFSN